MSKPPAKAPHPASTSNFIRQVIEADIASGKHVRIRTRFPPEPNGYLHLGHAKSILLNFGLAKEYGGNCNLRFDDTNPEKEEQAYVDSIIDSVSWLGADFGGKALYASDYFDFMYQCAEHLVTSGSAYVDSQSADEMKRNRGDFTHPGVDSPFRSRSSSENLSLLREMKAGKHADGAHVLRAKIDMKSQNMNLRDPAIYRIKRATHHRTGDKWCIYPMYTYAHPIEDAVEKVTHSLCTLEFEDQRPFYDWLLGKLAERTTLPDGRVVGGLLERPLPQQIEFARLNLTHVLLSKRLLIKLVEGKHVDGWDDPRMPTLAGARRRGYTAEGFRRFAERIGVSKANQMIDYSILEDCMREHLNEIAPRRMAVLDPIKLVIENYPEDKVEMMDVPNHPQKPEWGKRQVPFSRELWIERDDYMETPTKGYFRLFPGNLVRLRYGYVVKCEGLRDGVVRCTYFPETRSGTPGADSVKVKGNIHWVSVKHAHAAQVHLYDHLFKAEQPEGVEDLNPHSLKTMSAQFESSMRDFSQGTYIQVERQGFFVSDPKSELGQSIFHRTVSTQDSWNTPNSEKPVQDKKRMTTIASDKAWYEDDSDFDHDEYPVDYNYLSFGGSDFNCSTIYDYINSGSIVVPAFQRNYVWDQKAASKLIESLLIGLPVPQVFLFEEKQNKNLVIDGQQRLLSIYFFRKQRFPRRERRGDIRDIFAQFGKIPDDALHNDRLFTDFALQLRTPNPAQKNIFHGLKYETLGEHKSKFDLRAIRTVLISRKAEVEADSSVYEIFNRLNTTGENLRPQEIRASLYHSLLFDVLHRANQNPIWRKLLGLSQPDLHMKDVEFLLRSLAMLLQGPNYAPSMTRFLNHFSSFGRKMPVEEVVYLEKLLEAFFNACSHLNSDAFFSKTGRFSVAIFEAIFVAVCRPLWATKDLPSAEVDQRVIDALKADDVFVVATQKRTTGKGNVTTRLERADSLFRLVGD